ncbi:MAG: helix-turn-helix domain-containing protein [Clostridia bacterium]|nr:helix-turn-helix domain-containing protein [Clostridia bacterium]
MNQLCYYSFRDARYSDTHHLCSLASDEMPLVVNCAGNVETSFAFTTDLPEGREDFYLFYMVCGSMRLWMGEEEVRIGAGDAVLFPPRCHYRYTYEGGEPLSYLWVHFTGSYALSLLEECALTPLPRCIATRDGVGISGAFRRLFDVFECTHSLQKQELACALQQVILTVAKSVSLKSEGRRFETSLRYLHASYQKKISIPALARMENLSHSRYVVLFRKQMGMSPMAYVVGLRMSAACELLHSTDLPVKQVGVLVGYADAHFFSKLFKKHVGMSPQSYRQKR